MTNTAAIARFASAFTLAALLFSTGSARGDWPMQRHDVRRTATSGGHSNIDRPALTFRTYLGGGLGREQYLTADVDGDTRPEVLFIMGGTLVAKTPNDALVWETASLDLFRLDRLIDLDGDGTDELVASAQAGKVYVFRVSDGEVLWALPSGVVGNVGAVRFADFDLDGVSDLYLAERGCGSTGSLGDVGRVYRFADGFSAAAQLFELERGARDYVCGNNDTLADLDGDSRPEVIAQGRNHFYVYSGADGHLISASADIGSIPYGQATTRLTDVDADGTLELVCFTDNNYAPPVNSRRVFLMAWNAGVLEKRWERSASDLLVDRHGWSPGGVGDLGSDGRVEVVTSFYSAASGAWTTLVLDAGTGATLASAAVGPFRGLADVDGDGSSEVLVAPLRGYRFTGSALEPIFSATDMAPLYVRDLAAQRVSGAEVRVAMVDLDGDGTASLIASQSMDGVASVVALDTSTDPPTVTERLELDADISLTAYEIFPAVTGPFAQILAARSDGYLWVLDEHLQPTNAETEGTEFPERGLRIGGYYSGAHGIGPVPIAVDLDGDGAAEVVARDSRGVLHRFDVRGATLVTPPTSVWEQRGVSTWIASDVDADGTPEVVAAVGGREIRALRGSDGAMVWRSVVGSRTAGIAQDLAAAELSGDAIPDIIYELSETAGGTVRVNVLDGADGTRRWATDYETVVAGSGLGAFAVGQRAGAAAILITPRNLFVWLDPASGAALGSVAVGYAKTPIFADVDGAAGDEILASGAVYGVRALRPDLTAIWTDGSTRHTRVLGAPVRCADGSVRFVQGHNNSARLTAWNAADGSVVGDVALRDGRVFDPPESAPDGAGILGNVTVAPDLIGAGRPSVLVPSTDGHLYALDPCAMSLDWALDFRRPVGEAILADTDGDGQEEIIVTVADGYLYGVGRERVPAPAWVHENDGTGPAATPEEDVDELITQSELWANWAPVAEATSYEVAVVTPGGAFLTNPPFMDVGDVTEVSLDLLPLVAGRRYLFAVRALGAEGASSETLSDGVMVLADPCDACGPSQRCVDHVCEPDPCFGVSCGAGQRCVEGICEAVTDVDAGPTMQDGGVTGPPPASGCCTVAPGSGRSSSGLFVALAVLALALLRRARSRP